LTSTTFTYFFVFSPTRTLDFLLNKQHYTAEEGDKINKQKTENFRMAPAAGHELLASPSNKNKI